MIKDNPALVAFKVWIFPGLVSVISLMIWNGVNEIRSDIKLLMAQSNIDKTRIDNLEREVYGDRSTSSSRNSEDKPLSTNDMYAVMPDNKSRLKPKKIYFYDI